MNNDISLKQLYKEQLDLYPRLSQEEIVSLYEKEIVKPETIEELNKEISDIKEKLVAKKIFQALFPSDDQADDQESNEIQSKLDELEKKAKWLNRTYKTYSHKVYLGTRGIKAKDRKFPSNELRNEIVCGTLGIAKYWASVYYRKIDNTIPFDDLLQVAREALISAAHYYVPSDQAKFTTYARRCIENKLKKEVYNKNRMKKRTCKPDEFFQKEKDNIKYIQSFLQAIRTKSNSGKTLYYSTRYLETISVMLYRFKQTIVSHNREVKMREEKNRLYPSYSGRGTKEKLDVIVNRMIQLINESKLKTLVTNEDRDIASMFVNYQNRPRETQEVYQLIYYLQCYLYKLDLMERYFKVHEELTKKNDDIIPTDTEVLEELNKKIKLDNKERNVLRKTGLFEKKIYYNCYNDYYNEYKEIYKVDPFISPEEYKYEYHQSTLSSKKKERDDIASQFDKDTIKDNIITMIEEIELIKDEKIVLFFTDNSFLYEWRSSEEKKIPDDNIFYCDWEVFEEYKKYTRGDVFEKEDAIQRLKAMLELVYKLTQEDYVKLVLKQRKSKINAILKEKNAPIIEKNKEITKLKDKLALGEKPQKPLKDRQIVEIKKDVELLYGDDDELLILMNSGRSKNRRGHYTGFSVEDEALMNIFLEDYYKAVSKLPVLEQQVLLNYFDENGVHSVTSKDIGTQLDITEGQVYKLKAKALKSLSKDARLKSYMEEQSRLF